MKPYQIVSILLSEQDQSESDKNKKRLKHYSVAGALAGGAAAIYGGRKERVLYANEILDAEEKSFAETKNSVEWNGFIKSEKFKEYRRFVRKMIAKRASRYAILAVLTVAFYAFLRESKRKFDEAQKIKRMKRS